MPINDPKLDQETLSKLFRRLNEPCMVLLEDIDALDTTTVERGSSKASQPGLMNLSALLNILDGVAAKEGMILIMTSNHLEALDEALVRPGRVDNRVHFPKAEQSALNDLFMITYLSDTSEEVHNNSTVQNKKVLPSAVRQEEIHKLAQQFSDTIPPGKFTVAEVQAFLFHHKDNPHNALAYAATWSQQKRSSSAV